MAKVKVKQKAKKEKDHMPSMSNQQIIEQALASYPGQQKIGSSGWHMVCCPFHDDSSPSCGVRVTEPNLGVFNCLACPAKGGWNKFAAKTGLPTIKAWNKGESVDADSVIAADLDEQLLGDKGTSFAAIIKTFRVPEATPWPESIDWRGFPGKFMKRLGAHIIIDNYASSIGALFPVKVAGKVRGGVKAAFVKDENRKNFLSYITSNGSWVGDYGLFPFVYARQLIRRRKIDFIVVVEGPRDAMRLCLNGIPAVAVLGAQNITKRKVGFLVSLGIDTIYVMPDSDDGGRAMWRRLKELGAETGVPTRRIKLPKEHPKGGKMDPGNAPKKILRRVMNYLEENHNFTAPEKIQ